MFDTSIKTPKTPLVKRMGYLLVACIVIGAGFWVVGTLASMLLGSITPQGQPELTQQPYTPANQAIEVVIEVEESHSAGEDQ